MRAVAVLGRAHLRRRWPALVVLGLVAGVLGATVTGAAVAARRTDTAYGRMLSSLRPPDGVVTILGPGDPAAIATLPEVTHTWPLHSSVARVGGAAVRYVSIGSGPPPPTGEFKPLVVRGRLPETSEEVVVNADLPEVASFPLGRTLDLSLLTQDDFEHFGSFGDPHGPKLTAKVVGVVRVGAAVNVAAVLAGPGFDARYAAGAGGGPAVAVRLRRGLADLTALQRDLLRLYPVPPGTPGAFQPFQLYSRANEAQSVRRATTVAVRGLWAFAAVAAIAGLIALTQACARYAAGEAEDEPTLASLGATTGQRLGALVWPGAAVAGPVAAVLTAVGGVAASPLGPIGSARRFEPHPGVAVNIGLVAIGVASIVAVVAACLAATAAPATRGARAARNETLRPSSTVRALVRAGAPIPAVVGSRFALEPGGGALAVPIRTALAAAALGVLGPVAVAGVAGSLHRVTTTPARYGAPGDALILDVTDDVVGRLNADRRLSSVLVMRSTEVLVNGQPLPAVAVDEHSGSPTFPVLAGRLPAGAGEIALAPAALERAKARVDAPVALGDPGGGRHAQVVGESLAVSDNVDGYDQGAVVPPELLDAVRRSEPSRNAYITVAPDQNRARVLADIGRSVELDILTTPPTPIAHLAQLRSLLALLAAFLGVLGVVALAHAVAAAGRRRRRELGVLRGLGLTSGQAVLTLTCMALVIAVAGAALGMLFGVVAGNVVWRTMADGVHVAADLRLPTVALLLAIPLAAAVATLVTAVPGWRTARMDVADVLRAE